MGEKVKANRYWPKNTKKNTSYGDISVSLKKDTKIGEHIHRRLFSMSKGVEIRKLIHLQYCGWPDYGVPTEFDSIVQVIKQERKFKFEQYEDGVKGSTVVHCSAGVGRCGVYLTIISVLWQIIHSKELKYQIDVFQTVKKLRTE